MSKPKKHHIVPQMLLKHFALDGKIFSYNKKSRSFLPNQDIKNICIQKNFYGAETIIEEHLAEIESRAAVSLEKFKSNPESISQQDRENIAEFLCYMLVRTKWAEDFFAQIERNTLETAIIDHISDPQNLGSEEEKNAAEYTKKNGFKDFIGSVPRDLIIVHAFNPELTKTVSNIIYQMNWMLLEAPNDHFFILGDTAIIRIVPEGTPMGLSNPSMILAMPLSPKLLLMACWDEGIKTKKVIMYPRYVDQFNARSILWASETVLFNKDQYDKIKSLIEKCGKDRIIFDYNDIVSASLVKIERSC